jgi:hypothetical protein
MYVIQAFIRDLNFKYWPDLLTHRNTKFERRMSRRMTSQDASRPPSDAFMQSMRLASDSMKSDHFTAERTSSVGWKTFTAAIALFIVGLVLFITG